LKDSTQEYTTLDESFVDSIANFSIDLCRQYLDLDVESIIYDERYDQISVKINDIYSMIIILGDKTKAEALLSRFVKIDNKRYYIKHHP